MLTFEMTHTGNSGTDYGNADAHGLDTAGALVLTTQQIASECVAVLGARGTGKSNDVALLLEQMLPDMPFAIIDTHGEYGAFRRFGIPVVGVAGKAHVVDVEARPEQMAALAELSFTTRTSVVIDLLMATSQERVEYVYRFMERLFELSKDAPTRQFYGVVIEEAQNYIPETKQKSPALETLMQIALEGRKFGLSIILASQRPALVSKSILGMCALVLLHSVYISHDIEQYRGMLPYGAAETRDLVLSLDTGQAIVRYRKQVGVYQMRQSEFASLGATPHLAGNEPVPLPAGGMDALERLREALAATPIPLKGSEAEVSTLRAQLEAAESRFKLADEQNKQFGSQLAERDEAIRRLTADLETLSAARVIAHISSPQMPVKSSEAPAIAVPDYRSPLQTERGLRKQERAFAGLLADMSELPSSQKRMLRWLIEREPQLFTVKDVARYLGLAVNTITDHPPTALMDRGLLRRNGRGREAKYTSAWTTYLDREYPDLNHEALTEQLLNALPR